MQTVVKEGKILGGGRNKRFSHACHTHARVEQLLGPNSILEIYLNKKKFLIPVHVGYSTDGQNKAAGRRDSLSPGYSLLH